jgi:hypothetical protein
MNIIDLFLHDENGNLPFHDENGRVPFHDENWRCPFHDENGRLPFHDESGRLHSFPRMGSWPRNDFEKNTTTQYILFVPFN